MSGTREPRWGASHQCPEYGPIHAGIPLEDNHTLWGGAISNRMRYEANSRRWWIDNGEYASPIRFCPWCGIDLGSLVARIERPGPPLEGTGPLPLERK